MRQVLVVLFADAFDQIRVGHQPPRQLYIPWLRIRHGVVNRDVDVDAPDIRLIEAATSWEGGQTAFEQLWSTGCRPTAIVAMSDIMAIGLLHGAHELGLSIPGDVSVVGYDDIELARYTFPPLTTVRQPAAEIGAAAANAVIRHLDGDAALPRAVALQPELIVRQSVRQA